MYFCRTNKAEQYFDIAMDLYFHKGVGATQIIRQIPISRSMLYRWIAKFAEANGLKESTDMSKNTAKGQPQSTLQEGPRAVLRMMLTIFAPILRSWRSSSGMKRCGRRPTAL